MGLLVRLGLLVAAALTGLFVSRDMPGFDILAAMVGLLLFVALLIAVAPLRRTR